jgi:hypothetical protein
MASSESNDLCSQGLDLLLQCGDGLLVLACGRSRCGTGSRVDIVFGGFELFEAQVKVVNALFIVGELVGDLAADFEPLEYDREGPKQLGERG